MLAVTTWILAAGAALTSVPASIKNLVGRVVDRRGRSHYYHRHRHHHLAIVTSFSSAAGRPSTRRSITSIADA